MKTELYATKSNISKKAEKWLSKIDRKRSWGGTINHSALLVLDMQRFFLDEESHAFIPVGKVITPKLRVLAGTFEGTVILTKHVHDPDETNLMNIWWKDSISGEMEEFTEEFEGMTYEVMEKKHYSAFHGTGLESKLKEEGIDSIIIGGVHTDLCCESTARDAFMRGFKVYFLADGTATSTEERHVSALRVISQGFGEVIISKELRSLL